MTNTMHPETADQIDRELEQYLQEQVDKATEYFKAGKPGRGEYELARAAMKIARHTGDTSSATGSSTLIAETWTKRRIPAARAPSIDFNEPSRSTVRLRSMLPSGPPPAEKTTASHPAKAAAKAAASSLSMSSIRTSASRPSSSSR